MRVVTWVRDGVRMDRHISQGVEIADLHHRGSRRGIQLYLVVPLVVCCLLLLGSQLEFLQLKPGLSPSDLLLLDRDVVERHGVSGFPGEPRGLQEAVVTDIPHLHILVLLLDVLARVAPRGTGKGTVGTAVGFESLQLVLYADVFVQFLRGFGLVTTVRTVVFLLGVGPLLVGPQRGAGDELLVTHVTAVLPDVLVPVEVGLEAVAQEGGEVTVGTLELLPRVLLGFHFVDHEQMSCK